ncbi:MAG: ABC transporter substrate-binding protein [Spirochaetota bacterium]
MDIRVRHALHGVLAVTLVLMLTVLTAAPVTATGSSEPPAEEPAEPVDRTDAGGEDDQPFLVTTDDLGREVVLQSVPTRVLGLARQFMEELFALGVTPIGKVDEYTNRPEGVALPSVGSQNSPNIESILQLEPELILANTRQHSDLTDALEAMGATVYFVNPQLGGNWFTDHTDLYGRLLDREAEAEAYAARLDDVISDLRTQVERCGFDTGILVQGGSETVRAAQPTGLYGALFPALGIQNVVPTGLPGAERSTFVTYDIEAITQEDPDVILVRAAGSGERNMNRLRQFYRESALWQELTAVRDDRIFVLPPRVNPGAASSEDVLRITADVLCPAP